MTLMMRSKSKNTIHLQRLFRKQLQSRLTLLRKRANLTILMMMILHRIQIIIIHHLLPLPKQRHSQKLEQRKEHSMTLTLTMISHSRNQMLLLYRLRPLQFKKRKPVQRARVTYLIVMMIIEKSLINLIIICVSLRIFHKKGINCCIASQHCFDVSSNFLRLHDFFFASMQICYFQGCSIDYLASKDQTFTTLNH